MWGVKNWPKPKGPSGGDFGLGFLVTLICIPYSSCGVDPVARMALTGRTGAGRKRFGCSNFVCAEGEIKRCRKRIGSCNPK
jgi:hypothetical protein